MSAAARRVLVAGIGNVFLGDDGFGVEVVRRIDTAALPPSVDVADYGIRGIHLAYDLLDGRHDTLIMVDAVPLDGPPGTLAILDAGPAAPAPSADQAGDGPPGGETTGPRPTGERPEERSAGERPGKRSAGEHPEKQSAGKRPGKRPAGEHPGKRSAGEPSGGRPGGVTAAGDRCGGEPAEGAGPDRAEGAGRMPVPPAMDGHGLHPQAVLALLHGLGGRIDRVLIVGCRPADLGERMGLSGRVAAVVDDAVRVVTALAREEASDGHPAGAAATEREPTGA